MSRETYKTWIKADEMMNAWNETWLIIQQIFACYSNHKQNYTAKSKAFVKKWVIGLYSRKVQKHRPRRSREEVKNQPSRFSAVIGRPGSDEPGRPITALNWEGWHFGYFSFLAGTFGPSLVVLNNFQEQQDKVDKLYHCLENYQAKILISTSTRVMHSY